MSKDKHTPARQWPDNITTGEIRYGRSSNYDGFYLADAMHGIPTIGSVSPTDPLTIRGQRVQVFNYPAQTEEIAKALCDRWNAYQPMLDALKGMRAEWDKLTRYGSPMAKAANEAVQAMDAAITKAAGEQP